MVVNYCLRVLGTNIVDFDAVGFEEEAYQVDLVFVEFLWTHFY